MKKIIFYDLETSGRSAYWDQIIQIAAICTDKNLNVLDEINNFNNKSINKLINLEWLDLYNDFESIASLLNSLDIFVTISNSTAHLAGALGVKTILIKPENFAVFHYWNQKTDNTPWYPSVRLINKKKFLNDSKFLKKILGT